MILRFRNDVNRHAFLDLVAQQRTDIRGRCVLGKTLVDVVALNLNAEQSDWLRKHIGKYGKAFEDVQFAPMA